MKHSVFETRSVHDLISNKNGHPNQFWIPAYQRGYRWKPTQVVQLLDDVREFGKRVNSLPEEYYCLQPLVLKAASDVYEVVDGQQRLTTLLLILRHFNERMAPKYRSKHFSLSYETRPELPRFLDDPSAELAARNVDFYYLHQAIEAIEAWFAQREHEFEGFKATLLNKTRVIWYELDEHENAVEAFTRLNVGKIPLTNDELIRALFLRHPVNDGDGVTGEQLQIAHEWDQLEKALQNDAFWYFLNAEKGTTHNRIGFLFSLVAKLEGELNVDQRYGVFHAYSRRLALPGAGAAQEWRRVKQVFMQIEEWFEDRRLYHIIGFLVQQGVAVDAVLSWAAKGPKAEFEALLRREAFFRLTGKRLEAFTPVEQLQTELQGFLQALVYSKSDAAKIRASLLMFNLATLLQSKASNTRFPFDSFKKESWDIEHIRSVTSSPPVDKADQENWLRHACAQLRAIGLFDLRCEEIETYLAVPKPTSDAFKTLYSHVLTDFQENQEVDDGIANLTLLDLHTNRSYKNAVFAVKRDHILALDKAGVFVPLCTRNLFLKGYSQNVDHLLFWSAKDSKSYFKALHDALVGFFWQAQEHNA